MSKSDTYGVPQATGDPGGWLGSDGLDLLPPMLQVGVARGFAMAQCTFEERLESLKKIHPGLSIERYNDCSGLREESVVRLRWGLKTREVRYRVQIELARQCEALRGALKGVFDALTEMRPRPSLIRLRPHRQPVLRNHHPAPSHETRHRPIH